MTTYRITISRVHKDEIEETVENFVHLKTAEVIGWSKWYDLPRDEQEQYEKKLFPTGKVTTQEREEKLYEQEKEDLDIPELAIYINRAR